MTAEPLTIGPCTTLPEARRLMEQHHFRRLPVVDKNRLVGIVTLGDVRKAGASSVASLSVFDLNFLLAELTIDRVMTRNPVTVQADARLSSAARLLLERKIGALPVLCGDQLVGIITESDILRGIVQLGNDWPSSRAADWSVSQSASRAPVIIN